MSFRLRLYLCLVIAVLVAAAAEIAFDTLETREQVAEATDRALADAAARTEAWLTERFSTSLDEFLDLAPADRPIAMLVASHVELWRGDSMAATAGDPSAPRKQGVVRESREIADGHAVVVTVDPDPYASVLYRRLRSDLVTDVGQLALALMAVWLLAGWLQRPVRRLTRQFDAMAGLRLPQPVPLPPGKDEFVELAESFNRMTENVQESFRRERAFTRYVSHELRTPLSAIQLQVESLRLGMVDGRESAQVLERNVQRIQRVLDALLALARMADQPLESSRVDRLIEDVLEGLDADGRNRVAVRKEFGSSAVVASASLVAQAVRNLLQNALKYTDDVVEMDVEKSGGVLRISIRDRGPGVPEDVLGMLKRPYVGAGATAKGTGLGLTFVKQAADALGGDLSLRNRPRGFEAELVLPQAPGTSATLVVPRPGGRDETGDAER